jgi:hypothetical protein
MMRWHSEVRSVRSDVGAAAGFRRVEHVCLSVRKGRVVATATGVLNRYPHTVNVSIATARRLVSAGVPLRVDEHVYPGTV